MNIDFNFDQIRKPPVWSFNGLVGLQRLFLANNQIKELPAEIFSGLVELKTLNLRDNQIRGLPVEIFNGLVRLEWLALDHNQMSELPVGIFNDLVGLHSLHLYGNPLLLVFYKELQNEALTIDAILDCFCGNTFNSFHQYSCRSAFARFYQFAAQGHALEEVIASFNALEPAIKNVIYGTVYEEAGRPATNDLRWGEHHTFDDKGIFNKALKRYVRRRFNSLSESQKNAVYGRVYTLAREDQASAPWSFSDPNWGREHAEDNVLRLIDAIVAVAPQALLS